MTGDSRRPEGAAADGSRFRLAAADFVARGFLADVEADLRFGGNGGSARQEQLQLLPESEERFVVFEQFRVVLRDLLENPGMPGEDFSLLDEGPDNVEAHFDGARAVEHRGHHDRTVLRESPRAMLDVVTAFQGHSL